jgi:uncharacterized protein
MTEILFQIHRFFERIPDRIRHHRWKVWIGFLVITALLASGLPRLTFDMSMESWFRDDDSAVLAYDRFREHFGGDDGVYIVYRAKDGDIFTDRSLRALRQLQNDLIDAMYGAEDTSPLSHIVEVKSLINVSYMTVDGDTLTSREFVGDRLPVDAAEREDLRSRALNHRDYPLFFLSEDTEYGALFIRTDLGAVPVAKEGENSSELQPTTDFFDSEVTVSDRQTASTAPTVFETTDMAAYTRFVDALMDVVQSSAHIGDLELYPVGNPILMRLFDYLLNVETMYIFTATIVLTMLVLLVLFRSGSAVCWPIAIVIMGNVLTLGLFGWIGVKMSMMISLLTMLILVVGVAVSVHILSGYLLFRRKAMDHRAALRAVFRKTGFACLLTSLTTSLGLVSMIFVPIPPIAIFGAAAAIGVMTTLVLSLVILPLMLDLWHPISDRQVAAGKIFPPRGILVQRLLLRIEPLSHTRPVPILAIFIVVGLIAFYGLTQVEVNSNMVEIIRESHPYRQAVELVDRKMGGTQSIEIQLDFDRQDALKDPAVLNAMEQLQIYLLTEHTDFVVRAESLVNVVKNTFQLLNENRKDAYRIPQERPMLEQTLFLFDMANPDDRQQLVTDDYRHGRISVRLFNFGSVEYLQFFAAVRQEIEDVFSPLQKAYPGLQVTITGGLALMMELTDYMSWSQIQSFGLALGVISVILLFIFGSIRFGLMALLPNLFPVLVTFGTMGLLGIPLDADTLIIAPIVIGIAVDDTIHFLTHFRAHLLESGDVIRAIRETTEEVGQAISFTSIILILGFLMLVFSTHLGMAHFGYLVAVAFFSALAADLLLLPALCYLLRHRLGVSVTHDRKT